MEKSGGEWCHCAVEWATQADRLLGKGDHRYAASDVKKDKMVAQHVYVDKLVLKQKTILVPTNLENRRSLINLLGKE